MASTDKMAGNHNEWHSGLWDCFKPMDRFCMAFCCPCMVFARTKERLRDPTLADYDGNCNGDCCNYVCYTCFLEAPMRRQIREKYNLPPGNDLLLTACCPACTLLQEEKELEYQHSKATAAAGYQSQPPMQAPMQAPMH